VIDNPYANKKLPNVQRTSAGLEPYTGPWGFDQVAHLLRRTLFGVTRSQIDSMLGSTLDDVLSMLLADQPAPSPPVNTSSSDQTVPLGQTWIYAARLNPDGTSTNGAK